MMTGLTAGTECRIFLVENDARDRFANKIQLEAAGFIRSVRAFASGKALLRYMENVGFRDRSVVCLMPLLILFAPGADSLRTIADLKSDPFLRDIPVLLMAEKRKDLDDTAEPQADGITGRPFSLRVIRRHAGHAWQWPTPEMWLS
jgi:hypothetical protein